MTKWTKEQLEALERKGRLLVSASAGSGKTSVMMERVARRIEEGGDVSRMVVLTFTNLAAAEMKEKLLGVLYERIRAGVNRAHLLDAVRKLPLARVSTIDAFCAELYRTYFERLGLSPDYTLLDEEENRAIFRRAALEMLSDASEGEEEELSLLRRYTDKQRLDGLVDQLEYLWRFCSVKPDPLAFLRGGEEAAKRIEEEDMKYLRRRAARLCARAEELEGEIGENWEKGRAAMRELRYACRRIAEAIGYSDLVACSPDLNSLSKPRGDDYLIALYESCKKLREEYKAIWKPRKDFCKEREEFEAREGAAARDACMISELCARAYERYCAQKAEENALDFSDLEHVALRLLEIPEVLAEVREGIDCVFVDEYQDTNGLQEEILNKLAGEELFLVGDVKQSIYAFRFAEPRLFLERRKLFGDGGGTNVDLKSNFRSDPAILDFVNGVMRAVMTEDFGGVDYASDAMLRSGLEGGGDAEIEVFLYPEEKEEYEKEEGVYSVKRGNVVREKDPAEGEFIATKLTELFRSGELPTKEGVRKVRPGDVAVITRRREISDLTAVFDKYGIPYRVEENADAPNEETRAIRNLLSTLDNARQDLPLAGTMTAFWGFREEELLSLSCREGFWYGALIAPPPAGMEEKLERFRAELGRYRVRAKYLAVDEILTEIMREKGFDSRVAAKGGAALGALNVFLERIHTHKYRRDLSAFLASASFSPAAAPPDGEGDAVTFLTVHKSKGLEFPVVFYAHTHEGYRRNRVVERPVIADSAWGIAARYRNDYDEKYSMRYIALAEKREREEKEEELRLTYVALTRARSKLFVSGKLKKEIPSPEAGSSAAQWIAYAMQENPALFSRVRTAMTRFAPPAHSAELPPPLPFKADLSPRYPYPQGGARLKNKYAVSALERVEGEEVPPDCAYLGAQKAEIGTAYHYVMEKLDFREPTREQIERIKAEAVGIEGIARVEADVIMRALAHPIFALAARYETRREAPFLMRLPGGEVTGEDTDEETLVQGVIDLVIETPEGVILVDYKVTGAPIEVLKTRYEPQIRLYRRALEESGTRVRESYLVLLNRAEVVRMG